ncbi:MAG: hypothetical protein CVT60_05110 [Actinobacteria bacterium HGW-Actinobacteria-10]|nr:MAG: hypothetical protein CVT60_05110 [Actinobacteria bacterium HGW-Actinobacteria-10]
MAGGTDPQVGFASTIACTIGQRTRRSNRARGVMETVLPVFPKFLPFMATALALLIAAAVHTALTDESGATRPYGAIVGLVGFISMALAFSKYTIDDTFISLRFARNLADGHGLVFSTDGSPPVEGYTNFLWVVLEAPLTLLPTDAATLIGVKALGILAGCVTLVLLFLVARELGQSVRTATLAALLLASCAYFAFWSVGGLETPLYTALIMAAILRFLVELRHGSYHVFSGLLFALAAMTRPEGILLAVVILSLAPWLESRGIKPARSVAVGAATGLIGFLSLFGPYFVWRYITYGYLLPNTFYAKTDASIFTWLPMRMEQLEPLVVALLPFLFFAVVLAGSGHLARAGWRTVFLATGVVALSSLAATREWMPGYRYEVPALPLLFLLAASGLGLLLRDSRWAKSTAARAAAILILVAALFTPMFTLRHNLAYTDQLAAAHVQLGLWLKEYAPEDSSYGSWDMGAVPYFSELPSIVEIHPEGILSNEITHGIYDIDSMMADFLVLGVDAGGTAGPQSFYRSAKFASDYEHLFSVMLRPDYQLVVHKRKSVPLSPDAIIAARELEAETFARWGETP